TPGMTKGAFLRAGPVVDALEHAADEETARRFLERLVDAAPDLADALTGSPPACEALVAVSCASRSLATALVADPSLVDVLRDPDLAVAREPSALRAG